MIAHSTICYSAKLVFHLTFGRSFCGTCECGGSLAHHLNVHKTGRSTKRVMHYDLENINNNYNHNLFFFYNFFSSSSSFILSFSFVNFSLPSQFFAKLTKKTLQKQSHSTVIPNKILSDGMKKKKTNLLLHSTACKWHFITLTHYKNKRYEEDDEKEEEEEEAKNCTKENLSWAHFDVFVSKNKRFIGHRHNLHYTKDRINKRKKKFVISRDERLNLCD